MEQAEKESLRLQIEADANQHFPGAVHGVTVLEHSDERRVEPGEMMIRVLIRPEGPDGQERPLRAFGEAHHPEIEQFRRDLSQRFPQATRLQFALANAKGHQKMIVVPLDRGPFEAGREGGPVARDLTPVMARLGPGELEIVDTLISAGIAANRAEAIRWTLARISERPAYVQLRERTHEIERLKTEF